MAYRAELNQIVDHLRRAGLALAHEIRTTWTVRDSALVGDARPSAFPAGFDGAIQRLAAKFGRIDVTAKRLAELAARRNLGEVDRRLAKAMLKAVSVDIGPRLTLEPRIAAAMKTATAENIELITSIPAEYLDKVQAAVEKSFAGGMRWEEMVSEIAHIGDVTETRAGVIARDQTSKMNAAFNSVRQTEIGIKRYAWHGALDQRERPSHIRMEGAVCRWDSPPDVDGENVHPGEAILCRCSAIPLIDLDELEQEAA